MYIFEVNSEPRGSDLSVVAARDGSDAGLHKEALLKGRSIKFESSGVFKKI